MSLQHLNPNANVVVAGASGGIGAEFVRQLSANQKIGRVFALYRQPPAAAEARVEPLAYDLTDEDSIRAAADSVAAHGPVDAVIVATGLLHDGSIQPEKSLASIEANAMLDVFRVNTVGPILLAKHFLPLLRRESTTLFAALSARVGSISDNRLGGWASYRASKAALNMAVKILHNRLRPEGYTFRVYHPGWMRTYMRGDLDTTASLSADEAAVAALAAERQGKFWEFYDLLFANYNDLNQKKIEEFAADLGMNVEQLKKDMRDSRLLGKIQQDMSEGAVAGVRVPPAVFVNGRIVRELTLEGISADVEREIKRLNEKG